MEYFNEFKWEITNPEVKKLDRLRNRLNEYQTMLLLQTSGDPFLYVSLKTASKIKNLSETIQHEIKKLEKKEMPLFDRLVLQDTKKNAEIIHADHNYFDNKKIKTGIGKYLSKVFGNSAYSELIESVNSNNFPHEKLDKNSELFLPMNIKSIEGDIIFDTNSKFAESLREKFIIELEKTKKLVDNFYEEKGLVKKTEDYHFQFAPASSSFSYWDSANLIALIDPNRVVCFKPEGSNEYQFFPWLVNLIGAHELAHGHQDIMSNKTMPLGLIAKPESYLSIVHGTASEGTAMILEDLFLDYMQINMKKLNLSKKDLDKCMSFRECYIHKKMPQIVHDILELKEREEGYNKRFPDSLGLETHNDLAEITGVKRYKKDYFLIDDQEFSESSQQMSYFFGEKRMKSLVNKMRDKKIDDNIIISALFTGFWCDSKAQEKFIFDLYLPKFQEMNQSKL